MFYDVVTSPTAILRICLGVLRDVTVLEPHGLARWSVAGWSPSGGIGTYRRSPVCGKIFYGLDEAGGPRDLRSPTCRLVILAHRGAFRFGQEGGAHEADQHDDRHHGAERRNAPGCKQRCGDDRRQGAAD